MRQLGLDLGGTNVKWAILEDGRELVASGTEQTHGDRGPEQVVLRLAEVGRAAIARHGPVDVGGDRMPGLYDRAAGTAKFMTNLAGTWAGVAVAGPVSEALGVPVDLINDARAFALAEATLGAGRGYDTVACYTLGTGIGGGVVVGGRLHEGLEGRPASSGTRRSTRRRTRRSAAAATAAASKPSTASSGCDGPARAGSGSPMRSRSPSRTPSSR